MSRYGVLKVCISHPIPVPRVREPAQFGGHSAGVTPLPIPNREVKPCSADGTWGAIPWERRSPPVFFDVARFGGPHLVLGEYDRPVTKVVLISGLPRSGTTVLGLLLGQI